MYLTGENLVPESPSEMETPKTGRSSRLSKIDLNRCRVGLVGHSHSYKCLIYNEIKINIKN